jgi:thioredoxin 1
MNTPIVRLWPAFAILAATAAALAYSYYSTGNRAGNASPAERPAASNNREKTMSPTMSTTETVHSIEHATTDDFQEKVLRSSVPVLVDFYADWCPPCRALAPVLEQFARETADAKVVKVNVDENPDLAARYQISSIPSLLVFRNGQPAGRHTGLASKGKLGQLLAQQ